MTPTRPIPVDAVGVPMACTFPGCSDYAPGGFNRLDGRGRVLSTRRYCTPHMPKPADGYAELPPLPPASPPAQGALL